MSSDIASRRRPPASRADGPGASLPAKALPERVTRWARAVSASTARADARPGSAPAIGAGHTTDENEAQAQASNGTAGLPARALHRLRREGDRLMPPQEDGAHAAASPPSRRAPSTTGERPDVDGPPPSDSPLAKRAGQREGGAVTESADDAARSLSSLRDRHGAHRQGREGVPPSGGEADTDLLPSHRDGTRSATPAAPLSNNRWASAQAVADNADAPSEQLQSLIESCCSRLWVSDSDKGVPQGVLLDLGRWMPGCTLEVVRSQGAVRISMRGVDADRASGMEEELDALGRDLADKLGCRVVVAVEKQKYPG